MKVHCADCGRETVLTENWSDVLLPRPLCSACRLELFMQYKESRIREQERDLAVLDSCWRV